MLLNSMVLIIVESYYFINNKEKNIFFLKY